jgi:hypothetical protein
MGGRRVPSGMARTRFQQSPVKVPAFAKHNQCRQAADGFAVVSDRQYLGAI